MDSATTDDSLLTIPSYCAIRCLSTLFVFVIPTLEERAGVISMGRADPDTRSLRRVSLGTTPSESIYEDSWGGIRSRQRSSRAKIMTTGTMSAYLEMP